MLLKADAHYSREEYLPRAVFLKNILINFVKNISNKDIATAAGYTKYKHYRRYSGWWESLTDYWYLYLDESNYIELTFTQQMGCIQPSESYVNEYNEYNIHTLELNYCGIEIFQTRILPFVKKYFPRLKFNTFVNTKLKRVLFRINIPTTDPLNKKEYKPLDIMTNLWKDVPEDCHIAPFINYSSIPDLEALYINAELDYKKSDTTKGIYVYEYVGFNLKQFTMFDTFLKHLLANPSSY